MQGDAEWWELPDATRGTSGDAEIGGATLVGGCMWVMKGLSGSLADSRNG